AMRRLVVVLLSSAVFGAPCHVVAAPAAKMDLSSGDSPAQMVQCASPDPARAIIGCTTIIRNATSAAVKANAYSNRAMAYANRGQNDLALADFEEAVKTDPKNLSVLRNRGDFYVAIADYKRALDDYNQAIAINSKVPEIYIQRA